MDQEKFDRRFAISCMIAAAFLTGLVLTGGLFWFLKSGSGTINPGIGLDRFSGILLLSGVAIFGAIPFARGQILSYPGQKHAPSGEELLSALSTSVVLSLVLLETACYFYLIYFFVRGEVIYLYAALIMGVLGFGWHFPRRERWKRYLDSHSISVNHWSNTEVDYGQR